MKHIFIINPKSGRKDETDNIRAIFEPFAEKYDIEFYVTTAPNDATEFVRNYMTASDEPTRFYACGGDGTLNEVASGAMGFRNASVSCYPCGSGNDFVKYYGGAARFLDPEKLLDAEETSIDIMKINDRYCVNIFNFGFDSIVCDTMIRVRRKPVIGGSNAYTTGVVNALLHGMKTKCNIVADGETIIDGNMLLCTIANGKFVGGQFQCAPRAVNDDGLLEICMVKPITRFAFVGLLGPYTKGEHLDSAKFKKIIKYKRAAKVTVTAEEPLLTTIDGEMTRCLRYDVECLPRALKFAVPKE